MVLGRRRKRSLQLRPITLGLNKNKQKLGVNGTITAQLNNSVNGTTAGNLAFVLNNPKAAYMWTNPLTRIMTRNSPNKNLQWQFGANRAPAPAAAPASPARPAAAGVISGTSNSIMPTASSVEPAARQSAASGG